MRLRPGSLIRFCGSFIATRAWIMGPEPDERKQDRQGARAEGGALSYQAAGELACDLITHARAELTSGL